MDMTTISIWEQESFLAPRDVLIVGGGLVGLWSAFFLKNSHPELDVALIERGMLPSGASTRNAGFACFGSPSEIVRDIRIRGRDQALQLVEMRCQGLEMIRHYFPSSDTHFEACGGYECFLDGDTYEEVCQALDNLNADLAPITGHDRVFSPADGALAALGLAGFDHLMANPLEGALHSGKLVQALTKTAAELGVTFLTDTAVSGWEEAKGVVEVRTNRGFSLRCSQLLICTNGFARELMEDADVLPARGQILVTAPIPGLALKGTFHFDEGFYYFRHLDNRVLLGGARNQAFDAENTAEMDVTPLIQQTLERFLHQHVPQASGVPIAYRWAGIMGMGSEKNPIIRQVSPQVFCAVRLSGVGVAISPLVGQTVAGLMNKS